MREIAHYNYKQPDNHKSFTMKFFSTTLLAALCLTTDALTLSASEEEYAKCRFYQAREYSGPGKCPRIDAELAVKFASDSTDVTVDFAFKRGDEDTSYTLDIVSLKTQGEIDKHSCVVKETPTILDDDLVSGTTDSRGKLSKQTGTTTSFTHEDVKDDHIYAMLSDDHDVVACCRLQDTYSKSSYDSIIRKINRV